MIIASILGGMTGENGPIPDIIAELRSTVEYIKQGLKPVNKKDEIDELEQELERAQELLTRMQRATDEGCEWSNLPADDADRGIH